MCSPRDIGVACCQSEQTATFTSPTDTKASPSFADDGACAHRDGGLAADAIGRAARLQRGSPTSSNKQEEKKADGVCPQTSSCSREESFLPGCEGSMALPAH